MSPQIFKIGARNNWKKYGHGPSQERRGDSDCGDCDCDCDTPGGTDSRHVGVIYSAEIAAYFQSRVPSLPLIIGILSLYA
jgi:hypothetical protein